MKKFEVKDIRNLAFISHGGTGKTTLAEAILFNAGASTRLGKVDQGTTVCDFDDDEKKRKISISAKLINCEWKGKGVFGVVTPGYADFFGDVTSALHVADGAVLLVCGVGGIEVGTQKAWKEADKHSLPRVIFVNKLDKENANFYKTVDAIRHSYGNRCVPVCLPAGSEKSLSGVASILTGKGIDALTGDAKDRVQEYKTMLEELAAETDDVLTEKYLNEGKLSPEEIARGLRKGVCAGTIVPIFCGSADRNIGVSELMDGICELMPSPVDKGPVAGLEEGKTRAPDKNAPFSAFVFKNVIDPYTGNLIYFKVCSGTLRPNTDLLN
ncbi:MAG TPA: GTP-binding protein, partial [bacterium]|nr:GTP-binding protein [bacterium]